MGRLENRHVEETKKTQETISRLKNPYFWLTLGGVILTSLQVEATSLTSWHAVGKLLIATISNPYLVVTTGIALLGVFNNPTTKVLGD